MRVVIKKVDIPKYQQQQPGTFPKINTPTVYSAGIAPKPLGYDQEGKPVFPRGMQIPPWGVEFGKHKGQITATSPAAPQQSFNIDTWRQGMSKKFPFLDLNPSPGVTTTTTIPPIENRGIDQAIIGLNALQTIESILERKNSRDILDDYYSRMGRTDFQFGPVRNPLSRGTTEMNWGEMFPDQQVPVQFPGTPVAPYPYFGRMQVGALVPSIPYDLPSDQQFYDQTTGAVPLPVETGVNVMVTATPEKKTDDATNIETVVATGNFIAEGFSLPLDAGVFRTPGKSGSFQAPRMKGTEKHNGIDLGVPVGENVYSIKDGVIKKIYSDGRGGKQIVIEHNDGTRSGYAHLSKHDLFSVGDPVKAGDVIGLSGNTGTSSGPHLHFTYTDANGTKIDPNEIFNFDAYAKLSKNVKKEPSEVKAPEVREPVVSADESDMGVKRRRIYGIPDLIVDKSAEWNSQIQPLNASDIVDLTGKVKRGRFNFGDLKSKDGFIIHHTAGRGTAEDVLRTFEKRNFPAHFIIDREGNIYQTLGNDKQGQHTKTGKGKQYSYLSNANTHGVEIIAKDDDDILDVQVQSAMRLAKYLGYKPYQVFSHGEINPHKAATEGKKVISRIRGMYKEGGEIEVTDEEIDYILANGGEIEYL